MIPLQIVHRRPQVLDSLLATKHLRNPRLDEVRDQVHGQEAKGDGDGAGVDVESVEGLFCDCGGAAVSVGLGVGYVRGVLLVLVVAEEVAKGGAVGC